MTKLELLEKVNNLNMRGEAGVSYWACLVLYNWVIWRSDICDPAGVMHEIVGAIKEDER